MDSAWTIALIASAAYAVACSVAGAYVSSQVGRPETEGGILGLVLGPFGVVVAACLPKMEPAAPKVSQLETKSTRGESLVVNPADLAAERANPVRYKHQPRKLMG